MPINMFWDSSTFLGALTPKFYVALTSTSSLISGLILVFEWWYFRKYGTSFIEQVSLKNLLRGRGARSAEQDDEKCKVWRNPLSLLRGAEYGRLWCTARRAPLTYYDMNLSAQDHQAWFGGDSANPDEELARAWREREPAARVAAARAVLALRPDCAEALLLLAEEDAPTVLEAERMLRRAWAASEAAGRALAAAGAVDAARREAAVLAHVKRRTAMCARRLGRLREAARLFRELARDAPPALQALQLHENLLEVLLEQRAFADAQALVARYDDTPMPRSATLAFTAALLRARAAPPGDAAAGEMLQRAIDYNPHVPFYLLELRALSLPPEHLLRRGDSEALAYAFSHLRHWRAAPAALSALAIAWTNMRAGPTPPAGGSACAACADRELLSPHHSRWRFGPALLPTVAVGAATFVLLTLLSHRWPAVLAAIFTHVVAVLDPGPLLRLIAVL